MIEVILELLELAKKNKESGRYISVALGGNKFPESVSEGTKLLRRKLWKNAP
tara:strand:- start:192 stop:347 length:156 start_codon:yes stop_codon:yes gene_type:complete